MADYKEPKPKKIPNPQKPKKFFSSQEYIDAVNRRKAMLDKIK